MGEIIQQRVNNISGRKELIKRYEELVAKWDDDAELQELFPEKYMEIKNKLLAIKAGLPYRTYDATNELINMITDMGAKIRDTVIVSGGMLGNVKPSKYDYKTDITSFVDKIIKNRLYKSI